MLFSPFPMTSAPPATPASVLVPVAPVAVPPVVYRQGAIMLDYLASPSGLDIDLQRSDAAYAADNVGIAQQVDLLLRTFKGERIDDQTLGIDYAAIFAIGATQSQQTAIFRRAIASVNGIRAITSLAVSVANGTCNVTWSATTALGALASGQTIVNGGA